MYINNKWLKLIFRLLIIGVCLWGIILTLSLARPGGIWDMLSYYTVQSNIIVLLFFVGLTIYTLLHHNKPLPPTCYTVKGSVMTCIILTLLIFHFVLRPTLFSMAAGAEYANSLPNILVHYAVPLMTLADWLLFDRKGSFKKLDPLIWTIIPWAYLAFSLIRAQFTTYLSSGSRYPYFFIDIDQYGVGQVIINILIVAVGYVTLGYIIYFIDFGLSKISDKLKPPRHRPSKLHKS